MFRVTTGVAASKLQAMLLVGQYDSPFVRRVAIALALNGISFDHRPWSTFRDADKFRAHSPLTKVPTLVFDDGAVLVDSHLILDWIESVAAPGASLWPTSPADKRRAFALTGLATGASDVAVSLFYEKALHPEPSRVFTERRTRQMLDALAMLEAVRSGTTSEWLIGGAMGHVDIALAVSFRFAREGHPAIVPRGMFPALDAFSDRLEALPVFKAHEQVFIAPA